MSFLKFGGGEASVCFKATINLETFVFVQFVQNLSKMTIF